MTLAADFFVRKVALCVDRLADLHGVPNGFVIDELVMELHVPAPRGCRLMLGRLFRSPAFVAAVAGSLERCRFDGYRVGPAGRMVIAVEAPEG